MPINPDKIQEMESPFYAPQKDVFDGDSFGPVIQLGVTLKHFTGDLYIKSEHFDYIARTVLGMHSCEEFTSVVDAKAELEAEVETLKREIEELKGREQSDFDSRLDELFANYSSRSGRNGSEPPVANDSAGAKSSEGKHPKANRKSSAEINLNIE